MRKSDIISKVAIDTRVPRGHVLIAIERMMDIIKSELLEGREVTLRGFGTFHPKKRAEKIAQNIKKRTEVIIPEHCIPAFRPAKKFKNAVKLRTINPLANTPLYSQD